MVQYESHGVIDLVSVFILRLVFHCWSQLSIVTELAMVANCPGKGLTCNTTVECLGGGGGGWGG